jgi:hypothetical protein
MEQQDVRLERPEIQGSALQNDTEAMLNVSPRSEEDAHAFPETHPAVRDNALERLKVQKNLVEEKLRNELDQRIRLEKVNSDLKEKVRNMESVSRKTKDKQGENDELKGHLDRTAADRNYMSRKVDDSFRKSDAYEKLKSEISTLQTTVSESEGRLRQAKQKERRALDHAATYHAINEEFTSERFQVMMESYMVQRYARQADDIEKQDYDQVQQWLSFLHSQNGELQRDMQQLHEQRQQSPATANASVATLRSSIRGSSLTTTGGRQHLSSLGQYASSSNFAMTPWGNNFSPPGTRPQSAYESANAQPTAASREVEYHEQERASLYGPLPHNVKTELYGTDLPTPVVSRGVMSPDEFAHKSHRNSKKAVSFALEGGIEAIGAQAEHILSRPALRSRRATTAQPLKAIIKQSESSSPALGINSPQARDQKIASSIRPIDLLLSRSQGMSQIISPEINVPPLAWPGEASSTPEILPETVYQPGRYYNDHSTQTKQDTLSMVAAKIQAQTTPLQGASSGSLFTVQTQPHVNSTTINRQICRQQNRPRPVELPGGAESGTLSLPSMRDRVRFFDPGRAQRPDSRNRLALDTSRSDRVSANSPVQRTCTPAGLPAPNSHGSPAATFVPILPVKAYTHTGVGATPVAQNEPVQTASEEESTDPQTVTVIAPSLVGVEVSEKMIDLSPDVSAVTVSDNVKPARPNLRYYVEPWGPENTFITAQPSPAYYVTQWGPADTPEIAPSTPEDFARTVLPPPEDVGTEADRLISVSEADSAVSETSEVDTSQDQAKIFDVQTLENGDVVQEDDSTLLTVPDAESDLQGRQQSKLAIGARVPAVLTSPVSPKQAWAASNGVPGQVPPPSPEHPLRRQHAIKDVELAVKVPSDAIVPAGPSFGPGGSQSGISEPGIIMQHTLWGPVPFEVDKAGLSNSIRVRRMKNKLDSPPPSATFTDSDQKSLIKDEFLRSLDRKRSFHRDHARKLLEGELTTNNQLDISPPVLPPVEERSTLKIVDQEDAAAIMAVPDGLNITIPPSTPSRASTFTAAVIGNAIASRRSSLIGFLQAHTDIASSTNQEDDLEAEIARTPLETIIASTLANQDIVGSPVQEDDIETELARGPLKTIIAPPQRQQSVAQSEKKKSFTVEDDAPETTSIVIAPSDEAPAPKPPTDAPMTPAGLAPGLYLPPNSTRRAKAESEEPGRNTWLKSWNSTDVNDRGTSVWLEECQNLGTINRGTEAYPDLRNRPAIRRAEQVKDKINSMARGLDQWLPVLVLTAYGYARRLPGHAPSLAASLQVLARSMVMILIGLTGVVFFYLVQLRDAVDMWQSVNVNPSMRYHILSAREGFWGNSWLSLLEYGSGIGTLPALLV